MTDKLLQAKLKKLAAPPTMKIDNHDRGQAGELVFYAHGSESMRTYLGLSKFHSRADCPALIRRGGTIVRDRMDGVLKSRRCKSCNWNEAKA